MRPGPDVIAGGQADAQFVEEVHVQHVVVLCCLVCGLIVGLNCLCAVARVGPDLFDAARLTPRQVDTQLLGCPEVLVVGVLHVDGRTVPGQHLDVQAQRLHLLDQNLERLRNTRLGMFSPFTMASWTFTRPSTSSDLMVNSSCNA